MKVKPNKCIFIGIQGIRQNSAFFPCIPMKMHFFGFTFFLFLIKLSDGNGYPNYHNEIETTGSGRGEAEVGA